MARKHLKSHSSDGSRIAVIAALVGNIVVALLKAMAAAITGSAAMFGEAVHSLADTGNEVVLLYGYRRARRRPDAQHPLGYGREIYFWSYIVALMLFGLGAVASIYRGVTHLMRSETIDNPVLLFSVLGLSLVVEVASFVVSWRNFAGSAVKGDLWKSLKTSKDPPSFLVFLEDCSALIGILIAALGVTLAVITGNSVFDATASIAIGMLLAVVASGIAIKTKSLLIGEGASPELIACIARSVAAVPGLEAVNGAIAVHLSPNEVLLALSIDFEESLSTRDIERAVGNVENRVRAEFPEISALFIKPQSPEAYRNSIRLRFGDKVC